MTTYHIDLATGAVTQLGPAAANAAYTPDDCFSAAEGFLDPEALQDPQVRRALGDIYQALRDRRFAQPTEPAVS